MAIPTLVQHAGGDVVSGTSFTSAALAAPATAGNALVIGISGDKNTGALSGLPAGWQIVAQLPSTSVSQYLAFGTAVGGETTVSCTLGSAGGGNGNSGWIAELSQAGAGAWSQVATSAQHATDESTATVWATTSSGVASRDGLGIGIASCDSALNITAGSWSSSALTSRYDTPVTGGTGGGGASTHIGTAGVTAGSSLGSTWTTTSGGADQLSASLMVIGRAAVGPPIVTATVEVEFVPGSGTWVDITDRCIDPQIVRPRTVPGEGAAPTTLTVTLKNHPSTVAGVGFGYCPFVPNSPASKYWPNVVSDRRVRVTATSGVTSWVRFLGFVDKWLPEMPDGAAASATTTLTASDALSRYSRKRVLSYYGESLLADANVDYWPFDDPTDSATVRGLSGSPVAYPGRDGLVVQPNRPPGSATLGAPDGGHLGDGQIQFTRGDDNTPAPVVLLTTRPGVLVNGFSASYRLTNDPKGSTGDDAVSGYNSAGELLWRWDATLSAGTIVWNLYDSAGVAKSFWDTRGPRDEGWHWWQVVFTSTGSVLRLREKGGSSLALGSFVWTYDPRTVAYIVVGGNMIPQRKGKQGNTLLGDISSFAVHYATGTAFSYSEFTVPGVSTDADRVTLFLNQQGAAINSLTGGAVTPGSSTDARQLMYTNETRDLLSRWNEHALTTGGHLCTLPDGRRRYRLASQARPLTVSLTLDAADDLDIPTGGWSGVQDEKPTRITATGPVGSITLVDAAAESGLAMSLEGTSLTTSAGTLGLAQSAAAYVMGGDQARLSSFGVDLTLTGTDKVAAAMALTPGDRVRITGLPSEYIGLTYAEVYASGWTEVYGSKSRSCAFVFDTDPADDPAEGVLDNAEYGRTAWGDGVATVTGGTCVGNTGTGNVIITSSSPASTAAGDYPVDLDWLGEAITVTAPGGSTSPQTFPVTARGVGPTVARVHAAGEAVDAWHAATAAL